MKKRKIIFLSVIILVSLLAITIFSITLFDDPVSTRLRTSTETSLNKYISELSIKSSENKLTSFDNLIINSGVLIGVVVNWFKYPEAANILYHYVYGDGSDLGLNPDYLKRSKFINKIIGEKGPGKHGPIALKQSDDWRLSLAINPFYISVTDSRVKIYHPKIEFAKADDKLVHTIVPIGKLRIRVYDNLVSALETKPFFVYAEWPVLQSDIVTEPKGKEM